MTAKIGEEYGRWARDHQGKRKPRIFVVGRLRGEQWWRCQGGINYDGHGLTPAEAYRNWLLDLIPF